MLPPRLRPFYKALALPILCLVFCLALYISPARANVARGDDVHDSLVNIRETWPALRDWWTSDQMWRPCNWGTSNLRGVTCYYDDIENIRISDWWGAENATSKLNATLFRRIRTLSSVIINNLPISEHNLGVIFSSSSITSLAVYFPAQANLPKWAPPPITLLPSTCSPFNQLYLENLPQLTEIPSCAFTAGMNQLELNNVGVRRLPNMVTTSNAYNSKVVLSNLPNLTELEMPFFPTTKTYTTYVYVNFTNLPLLEKLPDFSLLWAPSTVLVLSNLPKVSNFTAPVLTKMIRLHLSDMPLVNLTGYCDSFPSDYFTLYLNVSASPRTLSCLFSLTWLKNLAIGNGLAVPPLQSTPWDMYSLASLQLPESWVSAGFPPSAPRSELIVDCSRMWPPYNINPNPLSSD